MTKKIVYNFDAIIIKVSISQKLGIAQRKSFIRKVSVRSISIYLSNLATVDENWIFGRLKRPFWTPVKPKREMMWYEILRPSIFSAHCASLISRWPLLRRGRGSAILIWDRAYQCSRWRPGASSSPLDLLSPKTGWKYTYSMDWMLWRSAHGQNLFRFLLDQPETDCIYHFPL